MRLLATLAVLSLSSAPQDAAFRELLDRLQEDAIDARDEAASALVRLGPPALGPLREALKSASGERRLRIGEVIRSIEARERVAAVLRPATLVSLEARDRPVREVLEELGRKATTPLDLSQVPADAPPVTVALSGKPFWEALDEICRASGQVCWTSAQDRVILQKGVHRNNPRRCQGPFALYHHSVEARVTGSFGAGGTTEQLTVALALVWEKGTRPDRVTLHPLEIRDDLGTDLMPPKQQGGAVQNPVIAAGHIAVPALNVWSNRAPAEEAARIARMKLEVAVDFILEYGGVTFRQPGPGPAAVQTSEKFNATLQKFSRQGSVVQLHLQLAPADARPEGIQDFRLRLKDKEGKTLEEALAQRGWGWNGRAFSIATSLDLSKMGEIAELSVVAPFKVHTERIIADFKDLPLK